MLNTPLNGFILHRRPYRETSFLLDIFSLEAGKISAVGKGIRGAKNDKKSLLQPFQSLQMSLSGKHELKNLLQVEALSPSLNLQGERLFSAMYINELLNRLLLPEVPQPELYALYQQTLEALVGEHALEPILRQFELSLLADLGYGIDFFQDGERGAAIVSEGYYAFIHEQGWWPQATLQAGRLCFRGEIILQIAEFQWTSASLQCAKQVTRFCLNRLLGDKPLKSRELFKNNWSQIRPQSLENGT